MTEQTTTNSPVNTLTAAAIEQLYHGEGRTLAQTAAEFDLSVATLRLRMAEFGIETRGRGKRKVTIDKEKIVSLYVEQGLTLAEAGAACNVSAPTFRRCMDEHGVEARSRGREAGAKMVEIDENELESLYVQQGFSLAETAEALNVSTGTVRDRMEVYGIPARSPGRPANADEMVASPEPELCEDDVTRDDLRELAKELGVSTTGRKAEIFERVVAAKAAAKA